MIRRERVADKIRNDKMGSTKRASKSNMVIPALLAMATLVKAELTHNETEQCEFLFFLNDPTFDLGTERS